MSPGPRPTMIVPCGPFRIRPMTGNEAAKSGSPIMSFIAGGMSLPASCSSSRRVTASLISAVVAFRPTSRLISPTTAPSVPNPAPEEPHVHAVHNFPSVPYRRDHHKWFGKGSQAAP